MESLEKRRANRINEALAITCIVGTMLFFIGLIDVMPNIQFTGSYVPIYIFIICTIAYGLWFLISKYEANLAYPKLLDYSVIAFITAALIFFIYRTGAHESRIKILLLIPLTIASIRYGRQVGLYTAGVSTLGIIVNDLIKIQFTDFNPYLQGDLILIGILFTNGWIIGSLIETEKDVRAYLMAMANVDELTTLCNHRSFQEKLSGAIRRAEETGSPLSLVILDVDYFKHYNDLYGHQRGDEVLQVIARIMRDTVRDKDTVARYGGEEFAIIIPDATAKAAGNIAERVRGRIEREPFFGVKEQPGGRLTVSAGVATYPANAQSKEELIRVADMALYQAKYSSKNRVELYFSVLDSLKEELNQDELALLNTIKTLINVVNAKDRYTSGHSGRVMNYALAIGKAVGCTEAELKIIRYSAFLHDVGKIEISRELLNKRDPLTPEELQTLHKHSEWGADIIRPVSALQAAIPVILHHHEWYDGSGYPAGLVGEQIPRSARILCAADCLDAMSTDRPYKKRKNREEVKAEFRAFAGRQFDPHLAAVVINLLEQGALSIEYAETADDGGR